MEILEFLAMPGLIGGLIAGGGGAYLLGVRDPFLIGLAAAAGGILGLAVDIGFPRRRKPADEPDE